MNLYLLTQTEVTGYDTFDSIVVCAPNEDVARNMDPFSGEPCDWTNYCWAMRPASITVTLLGVALPSVKQGIVCSSFNAG